MNRLAQRAGVWLRAIEPLDARDAATRRFLARALPVCVLAWGHLALVALMSGAGGAVWGVAGFTAGAAIMVPNPVARVHLVQLSAMSLTVIGFGTVLRAMLVGAAQ